MNSSTLFSLLSQGIEAAEEELVVAEQNVHSYRRQVEELTQLLKQEAAKFTAAEAQWLQQKTTLKAELLAAQQQPTRAELQQMRDALETARTDGHRLVRERDTAYERIEFLKSQAAEYFMTPEDRKFLEVGRAVTEIIMEKAE